MLSYRGNSNTQFELSTQSHSQFDLNTPSSIRSYQQILLSSEAPSPLVKAHTASVEIMAAAISGGVPAKLEKKPVKFSNLLCEHNAGVTNMLMRLSCF